ncbi:iron uptake transporter deferrochelatase/peroxidase subunit [Microbacterium dextranolyticum]|uniref:Deferrochelatase n=1 Tax=Microbacterium dextranolyticum TaxID=36806 RepID=A0A9W6HNW8_9MICO|nr:iron uptake transporter deferrochelatase/peroxidase subunit [Microbacterium dextranolyticum]MBM7462600.1 deferrochelatase/peroxidase EfeB [Microbacterium dextranolyticum]GLJ96297.1 iron-dependent peroxidase [Microbacterium dextranolyticum]
MTNTPLPPASCPVSGVGRRGFLRGALGTGLATGAALAGFGGGALATAAHAQTDAPASDAGRAIPFHGIHQAGILTPPQAAAAFVAFDLTTGSVADTAALLQTITDRARALTAGGTPANLGISAPPSDSGILGPDLPAAGLTVTLGVGSSFFDRWGLAARRPTRLRPMDTFVNDDLDRARCDGDLLLQICADSTDVVLHALRDIARHTRGGMQVRWRVDGFQSPSRPSGASRNLLGFKDGIANPAPAEADALLWVGAGGIEPAWATGGSYQVTRIIRMLVEFWDRVTLSEQERMIGRRRDSGAPLTGSSETDAPDYTDDPLGSAIPLDAHIRRANPRSADTDDTRLLRRGYNYDGGTDVNGNLDMGLVFTCFQQDLDRQFVTVQKRLADEPLADYISPVGGGYFFALPGVRDASDWLGRGIFA